MSFSNATFLRSCERCLETIRPIRLQHVVDGMHLESPQGVLVVCGRKDNRHVIANQFKNFETIQLRHLDIEKQDVGFAFGDCLDGFKPVIHQHRCPFLLSVHALTMASAGISSVTSKHSSDLLTLNCARLP